ncbi:hypothetical protein LAN13_21900, partial [Mycobacterium tuberculosis]|nr:hypothetical protein [Mycobacterium tuberculosis]
VCVVLHAGGAGADGSGAAYPARLESGVDAHDWGILQATGLPRRLFPRLVEAGQPIGALLPEAAALLGLPVGIPVISAGHDTQFALFGAGAGQDEPVLSSG